MRVTIKIARALVTRATTDLERQHPFAAERIGFLLAQWTGAGDDLLVFPTLSVTIPDDEYEVDRWVGARIGSAAIRRALQATLTNRAACIHVHVHPPGIACFSRLDLAEQDRLMPSFVATNPTAPHGALVLAGNQAAARLWTPGSRTPAWVERIVVVGYPMVESLRRES